MNPMKSKYHSDLKSTIIHLKKNMKFYAILFFPYTLIIFTSSSEFYPNILRLKIFYW